VWYEREREGLFSREVNVQVDVVGDSRIEAQQLCFDFDMCCGQSSLC